MSTAESSLELFLSGFAARDIAEPLAPFDETTPLPMIRAAMVSDGQPQNLRTSIRETNGEPI